MARKANIGGLLALGAVGVGAYFLFFRNGAKAPAAPAGIPSTSLDMGSMQSVDEGTLTMLIETGTVPPGTTNVMTGPMVMGIAPVTDMPGVWVVPESSIGNAAADLIPEDADSGSTSGDDLSFLGLGRGGGSSFRSSFGDSFAQTVESQMSSPGVFQGYGNGFMQTIEQQQRGNVGSGIHGYGGGGTTLPYYSRQDAQGNFIPFGDYVQLPYHAGV